jgi:hypothetical protein
VSTGTAHLANALALAFGHGPLVGIAPALVTERDGPSYRWSARWPFLDGSVAIEAHGPTLDACHEKIADLVLRLWPELKDAAEWL